MTTRRNHTSKVTSLDLGYVSLLDSGTISAHGRKLIFVNEIFIVTIFGKP